MSDSHHKNSSSPDLASLGKDELLEHMGHLYERAKPHQDALAEGAIAILACSREVFTRIIRRHLPDVPIHQTRVVSRLSCNENCLGPVSIELSRRLNKFAEEGIRIVRIDFDENLHQFTFHAEPRGSDDHPTVV